MKSTLNAKSLKFQSKLPTSLGVIFLLFGLVAGIFLINKIRSLNTNASSAVTPQLIKITNIGSSSFTVSWITSEKTTGLILFGETTNLENEKNDMRDQNKGVSSAFNIHYVLIDNLKPESKYYFKIVSGGVVFTRQFDVTTATLKVPSDYDIAQGKILNPDQKPAAGALVYLSLANTLTQSALTDKNGNWLIALSTARSVDLKNFSDYDRSAQIEEISVLSENLTANATLTTNNDNPVPNLILGQTYNFLSGIPENIPTVTPIKNKADFNVPTDYQNNSKDLDLKITFPSEKEEINSLLPQFLGTGPTNKELNVQIESSQEITAKAKTDDKGNWSWSPQTPLSVGEHKITVSFADNQGFVTKVTHSFVVLAAGESDLPSYSASPSGKKSTPTPSATPLIKLSPIPSPSPTERPTPTSSPALTITPTGLTPTLTSSVTITPTAKSTSAPVSGSILPTKLFIGTGFAAILLGAALILF